MNRNCTEELKDNSYNPCETVEIPLDWKLQILTVLNYVTMKDETETKDLLQGCDHLQIKVPSVVT